MKINFYSLFINRKFIALAFLIPLLLFSGTSYGNHRHNNRQGASHGVKGAAKGGLGGAALGALIGVAAGDAGKGAAIGAASGIVLGGVMGHSQDVRENEEIRRQERIFQERAYQREVIGIREKNAKETKRRSENVAIIEGLNVTPIEIEAAETRAEVSEKRLKALEAEVARAKTRNQSLEEAIERQKKADARILELEAQLKALLKENGDTVN